MLALDDCSPRARRHPIAPEQRRATAEQAHGARGGALIAARTTMFSTARMQLSSFNSSSPRYWQHTMRLIRNSGKGGWLDVGKLGFGSKAAKLHIRMDSSAVSFPLSYS